MEFLSWLLMEDVQRIRATFSAGGPYGAPALLGALIFAGAYYVGRRRAPKPVDQPERVHPLDLPQAHSPPSLVAHRHAPVGAERDRVRLRLWHAGLRPVLLARRDRRLADPRIRAARALLGQPGLFSRSRPCCRSWLTNSPIGPPTTPFTRSRRSGSSTRSTIPPR